MDKRITQKVSQAESVQDVETEQEAFGFGVHF